MANSNPAAITRDEVAKVLTEIRADGENATYRLVRERLGNRGSLSTIAKHMEALKGGISTPELYLGQFPNRLQALVLEMGEMMDALTSERIAHMSALLEDERRSLIQEKNTLKHERELAVAAVEAEQRTNAELRLRLATALQNFDGAIAELDELRPQMVKAELLNQQLSERVLDGTRRLERLQSQFDTYEEETKKQIQRNVNQHAEQVAALEKGLDVSRSNELSLTQELGAAQRQMDKLAAGEAAAADRATKAEKEQGKLQELIAELSIEQTNSKKREDEREVRLRNAVAEKEYAASKLTSLQAQLIEAQANIEKLRQSGAAESRSLIINLVDHSRRVFELASKTVKKVNPDMQELGIAQREIERLFRTTD